MSSTFILVVILKMKKTLRYVITLSRYNTIDFEIRIIINYENILKIVISLTLFSFQC